jgi:hypothetical protein
MRRFGSGPDARAVAIAAALCLVSVGVASVGAFVLLEHPLAEAGVGGTTIDSFTTAGEAADAYTTQVELETADGRTFRYLSSAHENGTTVRRYHPPPGAEADNLTLGVSVTTDGTTYSRQEYPTADAVPTVESGRTTVVRGDAVSFVGPAAQRGRFVVVVADRVTSKLVYTEAETVTRGGERFARYEVVGQRGGLPPVFDSSASGYLLVEPGTDVVREIRVTAIDQGERVTVTVRTRREPVPVPGWVDQLRAQQTERT